MKPEDIDKLFRERLGDMSRTPSSDAWQRLQDQLQPPPKKKVIPMWWSIAASVAFLLLMGSFLYLNQMYRQGPTEVAGTGKPTQQVTHPTDPTRPDPGMAREQGEIAEAAPKGDPSEKAEKELTPSPEPSGLIAGTRISAGTRSSADTRISAGTRPAADPAPITTRSPKTSGDGNELRAAQKKEETETPRMIALDKPATRPAQVGTPAAVAPAAETIEVIILKQEPAPVLASAGDLDDEGAEETPSRRGKIVRGILKQVKNIASGEKVNLAEIGLDHYSIALETQIGNRKISKTINF